MGFLANAMHDDLTGVPLEGVGLARKSKTLFERLRTSERGNAVMQRAARAGEARAAVESVYALGLQQYLGDCRTLTGQLDPPNRTMRRAVSRPGHPVEGTEAGPWEGYPWIDAQLRIEEMICDDTPETREARRERLAWAEQIAQQSEYHLLSVRAHVMEGGAAQETGDQETASRLIQQSLRELYQGDSPPFRIANTIGMLMDGDRTSPRRYSFEVYVRESLGWWQMQEVLPHEAMLYLELAGAEMRIGKTRQAADHIGQAQAAIQKIGQQKAFAQQLVQVDIDLAGALLEHGDAPAAGRFLDAASSNMNRYSVQWALRRYAAARGQMEIAGGHLDEAEKLLEAEIHASEGNGSVADPEITADYAQTDHDLYAELAGVWLAQGREPKRILALWERFRLLVLGEPVQHCPDNGLDCDQSRLAEVQRGLSGRLLIGQILLPDRVLVYRVDGVHIAWSQTMGPRQTVPDEANRLQAAASSPYTSLETAEMLGSQLSAALLPALPEEAKGEATLLLEADPLLRNLPWPVLPSRRGPLGIVYPLEEIGAFLEAGQNLDSPWSGELSGAGVQDPARALVIGASIGDVGQPPLPDAAEEARVVGGLIHAQTVLIGQDATIASVANDLGSATVFHFAGHAVPSKDGTRLVLAGTPDWDEAEKGEATSESGIDGNFLRRHIPRACRLAVLSACTTGQRENSVDHPFQDMVATLGSLGVREVVATRWPIDSSTTVPFMSEFYKGITTGRNVALSLREARRVEFEKLSLKHPYTWGAFYVTGRGFHRLGRSKGDSSDKRWQSGF
jgi:CHAT domain-containing protein